MRRTPKICSRDVKRPWRKGCSPSSCLSRANSFLQFVGTEMICHLRSDPRYLQKMSCHVAWWMPVACTLLKESWGRHPQSPRACNQQGLLWPSRPPRRKYDPRHDWEANHLKRCQRAGTKPRCIIVRLWFIDNAEILETGNVINDLCWLDWPQACPQTAVSCRSGAVRGRAAAAAGTAAAATAVAFMNTVLL